MQQCTDNLGVVTVAVLETVAQRSTSLLILVHIATFAAKVRSCSAHTGAQLSIALRIN
jgi:hypothetical protein